MFRERFRKSPVKEQENGGNKVTLGDLGFTDTPDVFSNLGLAHAEVKSIKTTNSQTGKDTYFATVDYPLKGLGLVNLLEDVSSFSPVYLQRGIYQFWDSSPQEEWLQERYAANKSLPGSLEFAESHAATWSDAMEDVKNTQVYQRLYRIRFMDGDQFASVQLQNKLDAYQSGDDTSCETGNCSVPASEVFNMYALNPEGREVTKFLIKRLENQEGEEALLEELKKGSEKAEKLYPQKGVVSKMAARRRRSKYYKSLKEDEFPGLVPESFELDLYDAFLREIQTAPKELQVKVFTDLGGDLHILGPIAYIDSKTRSVLDKPDGVRKCKDLDFDKKEKVGKAKTSEIVAFSENTVTIFEHGVRAAITVGDTENEGYSAGLSKREDVQFSFPDKAYKGALIPLIAWEESADGKKFLTQYEAMQRLTQLDARQQASIIPDQMKEAWHDPTTLAQLDVMLGRVVLAQLHPDVKKDFPEKVDVEGKEFYMSASEVPMLASTEDVMQRLLSTDTMANLKNHIDISSTSAAL